MIYVFEDFALDAERWELWRGARRIAIEPQVFDLLLYLIRHRNRVVSKDDLIAAVWRGRIVSDSTISSRINAVRRAVGDCGDEQRLIRTYARRGLRFVGEVLETGSTSRVDIRVSQEGAAAHTFPCPRANHILPHSEPPSIEVRPFVNRSAGPDQDSFVAGIGEEITTALSQFRWLSVMRGANEGQSKNERRFSNEFDLRYVLEGSVRRAGNRVRITAQLVDTTTGAYLWTNRFDRTLDDILDLQDQVAERIVGAITPRLEQAEIERAERRSTEELDAYAYTLRGMGRLYQWTRDGINEALRNFQQAIEIKPEFAMAYCMAAYCYVQRKSYGWLCDGLQDIGDPAQLARRAAELAVDDAFVLSKAAHAISSVGGDIDSGAALIDQAIRLNPRLPTAWYGGGWIRLFVGKPETALEHLTLALRVSPFDPLVFKTQAAIGYAHFFAGRYDEASAWAERALCARPNYLTAVRGAAASHALAGRFDRARGLMAHMRRRDPTLRISTLGDLIPLRREQDFDRWAEGLRKAGLPD